MAGLSVVALNSLVGEDSSPTAVNLIGNSSSSNVDSTAEDTSGGAVQATCVICISPLEAHSKAVVKNCQHSFWYHSVIYGCVL